MEISSILLCNKKDKQSTVTGGNAAFIIVNIFIGGIRDFCKQSL